MQMELKRAVERWKTRAMAASASAVAATRPPCWSRRPALPPKRQAHCVPFTNASGLDVVTRSQRSPWHEARRALLAFAQQGCRLPMGASGAGCQQDPRDAAARLASRREKAISVARPVPTTSRNYAVGRLMSRVTLNMPTNSSSADGSFCSICYFGGARVTPWQRAGPLSGSAAWFIFIGTSSAMCRQPGSAR